MRITSISARQIPPVRLFAVDNLSDVVVLAGANGVGKTRLIQQLIYYFQSPYSYPNIRLTIEATCKEEIEQWGKTTLDTSLSEDAQRFGLTLQRNQRRGGYKSSILNFESTRTIQQIQPLAFSWDIVDPFEEDVSWNTTLGFMRDRFQDTVHALFKKIEHQKQSIATRAITLRKEGKTSMNLNFTDPLEVFKKVFYQLLSPKQLLDPSTKIQRLQYELEGNTLDIDTLSSGEREVVNIVFDFLLRKPENCIVIFDEPELHLHPELSYKLIQTLKSVGLNNQFIFCTHSPDIITASLDHSVVFLSPPRGENDNQGIMVNENDETNQALKLLGHSVGIIALGKKIVLIEGKESSLDKQVYGSIIRDKFPNLVLVPTGGKEEIKSFSTVFEKVLSRSVWGVDFYMLCDRDAIPPFPEMQDLETKNFERFRVLGRYHLENYFLDENIWAKIFASMEPDESWLTSPTAIRNRMRQIANELVSFTISLTVSSLLRTSVGNISVMPKDCNSKTKEEVEALLIEKANSEKSRVETILDPANIAAHVQSIYQKLDASLKQDTDDWKKLMPGKPLLSKLCSQAKIPVPRLKKLYINEAKATTPNPFDEIVSIFADFNSF